MKKKILINYNKAGNTNMIKQETIRTVLMYDSPCLAMSTILQQQNQTKQTNKQALKLKTHKRKERKKCLGTL